MNIYKKCTLLYLLFIALNFSCKKSDPPKPLAVGDSYQGGKIAYLLKSGDPGYDANTPHGLIAAPSDQSSGIKWWNGSFVLTNTVDYSFGSGNANTNTIISIQGNGSYAAKLCADLTLDGYSDWYLPSLNEIEQICKNKDLVGGFANAFYWTSTEHGTNYAYGWKFQSTVGYEGTDYKNTDHPVRAIRSF
jgi:hypothetical protein